MIEALDNIGAQPAPPEVDRPGWIPDHITANWDPSPYAYQTEQELMPQGKLHNLLMQTVETVLGQHLKKRGVQLWTDLFLIYRDQKGVSRRIAPDFMPCEGNLAGSSWNLDRLPVPCLTGEVTSPDSRDKDLNAKRKLCRKLGIPAYVVIDGLDEDGDETGEIRIRIWRKGREQKPDRFGFLNIPELHVRVKPLDDALVFYDPDTLQPLKEPNEALEEKDEIIAEKDEVISEKDEVIAAKDGALAEKDALIRELQAKLRDKED